MEDGDYISINHTPFYEIGSDTAVYYCRPYHYSIYELTTSRISKLFSFVFPLASSLLDTFLADTLLKGKRYLYEQKHRTLIYGISFPYQTGNSLFFKLDSWGAFNSYIYNLKSDNLVSIKDIQPDQLTGYLPLTDIGAGGEFFNKNFLTCDGKYVYTVIPSAVLTGFHANNVNKKLKYSEALESFFAKREGNDNPVIVQIRPQRIF